MAAPPVEGLKLQTKTTLKRVDELVHEYETTNGSGRLRDTLRGSTLVFAPPPQKTTSEAVARRRNILQARAERRAYDKMVESVAPRPIRPEERVATSLKHSFTVSANMVMTPVGVGAVGYRLAKHKVPEKHRIVVALVCGIGMLFVEMILFLARTYSVEAHTAKRERRAAAGRFGPAGLREATRLDGVAPKLD
ncbi:unnamed protein product [Pelagomonas calceolata]|uniref:Uncharacterized protein n=1 Tax=Pelagomonas calceolata TaxID=35677 RepID=A0A8J2SQA9_9STRA|nr:unnamed protein product [Pelagomonas calceolata]